MTDHKEIQVYRLTPTVYKELERTVRADVIPKDANQAAFYCGVHHVLKALRDGLVS